MSLFGKEVVILIILTYSFIAPISVAAQTIVNPLDAESIEELIQDVIDLLFYIGVAIAPIMIIIAAYYFLTSGGDPSKIQTAKNIIFWTAVGLLIILLARGIISVIRQILNA